MKRKFITILHERLFYNNLLKEYELRYKCIKDSE